MRAPLIRKAILQLGLGSILPLAWYRFKLRSGLLRAQTPVRSLQPAEQGFGLKPLFEAPHRRAFEELLGAKAAFLMDEAAEILEGRVRLFGAQPQPLDLSPPTPLRHWTAYTDHLPGGHDIKPIWELGRLAWAQTLARAYHLSKDEKYAQRFWALTEEFLTANPPNQGPHWSSAQEVALRLISLAFCFSIFAASKESTASRRRLLAAAIAAHAERIPPTLGYARAQDNNHLVSEALGLMTAAAMIPAHPHAKRWDRLGGKHFVAGLERQIRPDGGYTQRSANYHRLVLQLGLWAHLLTAKSGRPLPAPAIDRLAAATGWLLKLLDANSGGVPNLGPNDGARILPLTVLPFNDFRPTLQAAGRAFLGERPLPPGLWDELGLWLVPAQPSRPAKKRPRPGAADPPLRLQGPQSWAYLRVAHFHARPGHADQLHLDLWWQDQNIALDPGTYLYTAPPPWDNALAATRVHNTLTVGARDQMTRAGRFLWLDWAQARVLNTLVNDMGHLRSVEAEHDGYRSLGLRHRRRVSVDDADIWVVEDSLHTDRKNSRPVEARLHWLLPDWRWQLADGELTLESDRGPIHIALESGAAKPQLSLIRAGEVLAGEIEADPILGWFSLTYGLKQPALSLVATLRAAPPFTLTTAWRLPA